jgi:hypothetical protein
MISYLGNDPCSVTDLIIQVDRFRSNRLDLSMVPVYIAICWV